MAAVTGTSRGREEHPGQETLEKAKDMGAHATDKAKDMGSQALGKAKEMGAQVADKTKDMADQAMGKAKEAMSSVGEMASQASHTVAETLREGGKYIEEANLSGMAEDCTRMIRQYPVPAILIGVGVGFILGRAMRD